MSKLETTRALLRSLDYPAAAQTLLDGWRAVVQGKSREWRYDLAITHAEWMAMSLRSALALEAGKGKAAPPDLTLAGWLRGLDSTERKKFALWEGYEAFSILQDTLEIERRAKGGIILLSGIGGIPGVNRRQR